MWLLTGSFACRLVAMAPLISINNYIYELFKDSFKEANLCVSYTHSIRSNQSRLFESLFLNTKISFKRGFLEQISINNLFEWISDNFFL